YPYHFLTGREDVGMSDPVPDCAVFGCHLHQITCFVIAKLIAGVVLVEDLIDLTGVVCVHKAALRSAVEMISAMTSEGSHSVKCYSAFSVFNLTVINNGQVGQVLVVGNAPDIER